MKHELNDRYLKSLVPPEERRLEVSDTKCAGLRFRLTSRGHATWVYEKRIKGGKKRKFTFGTWPKPISLGTARKMALEIQAEASQGIDRVLVAEEERRRQKAEQESLTTVRDAIEAYSELHLSTIKTGAERKRQLLQALSVHLDVSVSELTRKDLQVAVDEKARSGRKPYANRIRAALVAFANWCFQRGYVLTHIGSGVAKATRERARDRVLSLAEVRLIWDASRDMGPVWGPLFRLLILTGQRRGEICRLRWSEVHWDNRAIVKLGSETKSGKPHITHLSDPAFRELEALQSSEKAGEFVFSFNGKRPVANASHAKMRLDQLLPPEMESWRIHDLRTAMATALAGAGVPEGVVDRILNHAATGSAPSAVARVYQQSDLLPQRASALDRRGEMVTEKGATVMRLSTNR